MDDYSYWFFNSKTKELIKHGPVNYTDFESPDRLQIRCNGGYGWALKMKFEEKPDYSHALKMGTKQQQQLHEKDTLYVVFGVSNLRSNGRHVFGDSLYSCIMNMVYFMESEGYAIARSDTVSGITNDNIGSLKRGTNISMSLVLKSVRLDIFISVSYTHLTLPTNREV